MITVREFVSTAYSNYDAIALRSVVERELSRNGRVDICFYGIGYFTTSFFNQLLGPYILKYGPEKFQELFRLSGLSDCGQDAWIHSFENACIVYNNRKEEDKDV